MSRDRRVGVELEFHGLTPKEVAELVSKQLGGEVTENTGDVYEVETRLGKFICEIDADFLKRLSEASKENQEKKDPDFGGWLRKVIDSASKEFVPTELVCPPIAVGNLSKVTKVHRMLAENGAQGTSESIRFAFGAQLNPEIIDINVNKVLREFQSFLILSDWLKSQIQIDTTRALTSFASDFPIEYQTLIFSRDYQPDMATLIDDYLEYNPTRNRGCDMLPLFMYIDEERVRGVVKDTLVKSRPTYHYRLPNCQLSLRSWTIEVEWSRWKLVEKLAQSSLFDDAFQLHRDSLSKAVEIDSGSRLIELNNYVERLRD